MKTLETYCGWMMSELRRAIKSAFEMLKSTYTAEGVMADFKDNLNGQEYIVEIRVKR